MMTSGLNNGVLAAAVLLTALMGFAIQRGATCTVAAVEQLLTHRKIGRLLSMLEASAWVAGGLLLASVLRLSPLMPTGHALSWRLVAGGVLLGAGAFVNRGCVFGAIARLSNGEWAYLATPPGFLVGCLIVHRLPIPTAAAAGSASPLFQWPLLSVAMFILFVLARLGTAARKLRGHRLDAQHWTPGAATVVIGIAFVLMLLLVGSSWAYTDVLAELSAGSVNGLGWRLTLLLALFGGGLVGGYRAGRWRNNTAVRPESLVRCFIGGLLMGAGSLLIPGSNDGLILLGMPLLLPHAWLAFLTMCATIAAIMLAAARRQHDVSMPRRERL